VTTYSPQEALRILADEPDNQVGTFRFTGETTIGAHSYMDDLANYARSLGMNVEHYKAGGWFTKKHRFVMTGTVKQYRRVAAYQVELNRTLGGS
jgi:hypothetical protein